MKTHRYYVENNIAFLEVSYTNGIKHTIAMPLKEPEKPVEVKMLTLKDVLDEWCPRLIECLEARKDACVQTLTEHLPKVYAVGEFTINYSRHGYADSFNVLSYQGMEELIAVLKKCPDLFVEAFSVSKPSMHLLANYPHIANGIEQLYDALMWMPFEKRHTAKNVSFEMMKRVIKRVKQQVEFEQFHK